jgi:hypothetical protein
MVSATERAPDESVLRYGPELELCATLPLRSGP